MLILTRKKNETICIGDAVAITVIRLAGNKVRLGITAPRDVRVLRVELDEPDAAPAETQLTDVDAAA